MNISNLLPKEQVIVKLAIEMQKVAGGANCVMLWFFDIQDVYYLMYYVPEKGVYVEYTWCKIYRTNIHNLQILGLLEPLSTFNGAPVTPVTAKSGKKVMRAYRICTEKILEDVQVKEHMPIFMDANPYNLTEVQLAVVDKMYELEQKYGTGNVIIKSNGGTKHQHIYVIHKAGEPTTFEYHCVGDLISERTVNTLVEKGVLRHCDSMHNEYDTLADLAKRHPYGHYCIGYCWKKDAAYRQKYIESLKYRK